FPGSGCVGCSGMLEGLCDRLSIGVAAGEQEDPLLGLLQVGVAAFEQADALFVARERLFQAQLPVFQLPDNAFQLCQGFLEGKRVAGRVAHVSSRRAAGAQGWGSATVCSTRLIT